jgi:hypothetical protein
MPSYLVEGFLPRSRSAELPEAVRRMRSAAEALTAEGVAVRHVRSSFLPADELFLHVLEAESAEAAGEATQRAGVAPDRIVEAMPVQPDPRRSP